MANTAPGELGYLPGEELVCVEVDRKFPMPTNTRQYLLICAFLSVHATKTQWNMSPHKRHHPKKNVRNCLSVYLRIGVPANKITASSWGSRILTGYEQNISSSPMAQIFVKPLTSVLITVWAQIHYA